MVLIEVFCHVGGDGVKTLLNDENDPSLNSDNGLPLRHTPVSVIALTVRP